MELCVARSVRRAVPSSEHERIVLPSWEKVAYHTIASCRIVSTSFPSRSKTRDVRSDDAVSTCRLSGEKATLSTESLWFSIARTSFACSPLTSQTRTGNER